LTHFRYPGLLIQDHLRELHHVHPLAALLPDDADDPIEIRLLKQWFQYFSISY
jgi:hypothetical protein